MTKYFLKNVVYLKKVHFQPMTKYLLKNVVYLKKVHERYLLLGSVGIMTPQGELIQILEAFQ